MFSVRIAGDAGLHDLARDLRRAGGNLRPDLTRSLRKPTKDLYDAVRRQVLTGSMAGRRRPGGHRFPSGFGGGNHVRRPALSGLDWKVSTAVGNPRAEITWEPARINPRVRPLFPYLVGQRLTLRHPVMGNRRVWVGQSMPDAWEPARRLAAGVQEAAAEVLDRTAAIIAGRR